MRLHHVAGLGPDPAALSSFYAQTLGLPETRRHADAQGVRSVWLAADGTTLMFERGPRGQNGVLVFAVPAGSAQTWRERLAHCLDGTTAYSIYARDPDGNRLGVSSYPEPIATDGSDAGAC